MRRVRKAMRPQHYAASAIRTARASTIALPTSAVYDARRGRQPVVQRGARAGQHELPAERREPGGGDEHEPCVPAGAEATAGSPAISAAK